VDEKNKTKFSLLNFNRHCPRVQIYGFKKDILFNYIILLKLKRIRTKADYIFRLCHQM